MLTLVKESQAVLITEGNLLTFVNGKEVAFSKGGKLNKIGLKGGDRFFVISSGMVENYQTDFNKEELEKQLKKHWKVQISEFMNKIFFNAKINKEGRFHYHDSSCIVLEVTQ